ncbi:hypothetical protein KSF78_0001106 [Schistosoma japonicum]|nr:hypothetical protein KSF78_0001106 [Schistosoma japonicum]
MNDYEKYEICTFLFFAYRQNEGCSFCHVLFRLQTHIIHSILTIMQLPHLSVPGLIHNRYILSIDLKCYDFNR